MDAISTLLKIVSMALKLYSWVVVAYVVTSILVVINIISRDIQIFYSLHAWLSRLVEPALSPIRSIIPEFGALFFGALILLVILHFAQVLIGKLPLLLSR